MDARELGLSVPMDASRANSSPCGYALAGFTGNDNGMPNVGVAPACWSVVFDVGSFAPAWRIPERT